MFGLFITFRIFPGLLKVKFNEESYPKILSFGPFISQEFLLNYVSQIHYN